MTTRFVRVLGVVGSGLLVSSVVGLAAERSGAAAPTQQESKRTSSEGRSEQRSSLRFEPNRGQLDPRVRYLARGKGYGLYLGREGATLELMRARPGQASSPGSLPRASDLERAVVSMHVVGARAVEPVAEEQLEGSSNYFVGSAPSEWRTGVENYARVSYPDVLPGVTLVYYGSAGNELEYDLILAPGAEPARVELAFDGVESLHLQSDGSVLLTLPGGGTLHKRAPVAYQLDERGQRVSIASRYELRGGKLAFAVGQYDHERELRIDPVLLYSSYVGGSSFDQAYGAATDAAGNTYLVGYTSSALFPTTNALQPALAGGVYDAFVCKLNASGRFVYATFLGGKGADLGYAIAADSAGNAYVTGVTLSNDFPVLGAAQGVAGGKQDAFVTKIDAGGSALIYSTYLGGSQDDYAQAIAVSATGNALLGGTTFSANFPTLAAAQGSLHGTSDAFVANLAPLGNALVYSTFLGGDNGESAHGVAFDAGNNAAVVGSTSSSNFPRLTPFQATFGGGTYDGFVSKLSPSGAFVTSTYLGGSGNDEAQAVAVQASGQATVVGYTLSANFPFASGAQSALASAGHSDAFVTRFNASSSTLAFSTFLGGTGEDSASGVSVDSTNTAYVVGSTDSTNFPLAKPIPGQGAYHGAGDGFVTAVDPSGSPFSYSTYLGGSAEDHAVGVAVQANGLTHVVGNTYSTDFPLVNPAIDFLVGAQDGFVARLPGAAVGAPAGRRWHWLLLAGGLLGLGAMGASWRRLNAA